MALDELLAIVTAVATVALLILELWRQAHKTDETRRTTKESTKESEVSYYLTSL